MSCIISTQRLETLVPTVSTARSMHFDCAPLGLSVYKGHRRHKRARLSRGVVVAGHRGAFRPPPHGRM